MTGRPRRPFRSGALASPLLTQRLLLPAVRREPGRAKAEQQSGDRGRHAPDPGECCRAAGPAPALGPGGCTRRPRARPTPRCGEAAPSWEADLD